MTGDEASEHFRSKETRLCLCLAAVSSSASCSLFIKLEIYGAQKLRVGKQDLRIITGSISVVFWYFNVAILISNVRLAVLGSNAGGTQRATSWKMCIITTLGLARNKQAGTQRHTFKRSHAHTHTHRIRCLHKPDITFNFVQC